MNYVVTKMTERWIRFFVVIKLTDVKMLSLSAFSFIRLIGYKIVLC